MRVLLVEDDPAVSMTGALVLRSAGHEVHLALDGAEALAWLAADGHVPDVVIVDIELPDIPGTAILAAAAERFPAAVLLATSGYPLPQDLGCDAALPKPFGATTLKSCIAAAVASRRARDLHATRTAGDTVT
jgi:two-component system, OmpR family, KDP operon response regulator KdpE